MPSAASLQQHLLLPASCKGAAARASLAGGPCCAGMVHCVRIKDGAASYCNRWVDTARLRAERRAGYGAYSKVRAVPSGVWWGGCLEWER